MDQVGYILSFLVQQASDEKLKFSTLKNELCVLFHFTIKLEKPIHTYQKIKNYTKHISTN